MSESCYNSGKILVGDTVRFYEDIKKTSENRLPQRNYYIPGGKAEYMLLCGKWRFNYYRLEEDVPQNIENWGEIPVPSCWQAKGYENPNYANVAYPYPVDPPYVPDENPCGVYERDFDLGEKWGKIYFVLEGVSSCGIVYVNGKYVGYTQGSHLQAEFDITDYVVSGKNTIRIKVLKWCVGSYLEDQDFFRFNGIFRDCYILKRPENHLTSFCIKTDLNSISLTVQKGAEVTLLDADGNVLGEKVSQGVCDFNIENPILWNAEKPYLYTLKICYMGEEIIQKVGLRTIEISSEYELLINGQSVKLHGVNHHDTHPVNGWCQTDEELRRDLELMKELNINCIRTSHYPPTPKFLEMCNEMGFYVILETDIETHGFNKRLPGDQGFDSESEDWPCTKPEWEDEHIERMKRAALRDINQPSVIMWSTGNESGHGPNHISMIKWLRTLNDGRLIHYEGANGKDSYEYGREEYTYSKNLDVYSRMYISIDTMTQMANDEKFKFPVFLCEYSHAMGNGPGDVYEYNETFDKYKKLIGGCVWEWADHTVIVDGVPKYGGDFEGELTHAGNFCCDGMVFHNRALKSGSLEVKAAYQPIRTRYENGKIYIYNRLDFTNLSEYEFEYEIQVDGKTVTKETTVLTAPPHTETTVDVDYKTAECRLGAYVICRLYKDGKEVALTNHQLPANIIEDNADNTLCSYTEDENNFYFIGENFSYTFSKRYGTFTSMKVKGKEQIVEKPFLSAWRAPIDNDRRFVNDWGNGYWKAESLDKIFNKVYSTTIHKGVITVLNSVAGVSHKPFIHNTVTYRVDTNGRVDVDLKATLREDAIWLPRFGFEFTLPETANKFSYFGMGPYESYCDMCHGSYMGSFESTADDEYVNYVVPQEHGNHIGVKKLEIGNLIFKAKNNPMEINVSKYSSKELTKAMHIDELETDGFIHLRVDYKVSGVGSNACGPELMEKYRVNEKKFEFAYSIEPNIK